MEIKRYCSEVSRISTYLDKCHQGQKNSITSSNVAVIELVDCIMFKVLAANLNTAAIIDFISKSLEDCMPKKSIRVLHNWKP